MTTQLVRINWSQVRDVISFSEVLTHSCAIIHLAGGYSFEHFISNLLHHSLAKLLYPVTRLQCTTDYDPQALSQLFLHQTDAGTAIAIICRPATIVGIAMGCCSPPRTATRTKFSGTCFRSQKAICCNPRTTSGPWPCTCSRPATIMWPSATKVATPRTQWCCDKF